MIDTYLVAQGTKVTAKGDGAAVSVDGLSNRILLLTLKLTDIIEQESLEVSVYGSADGTAWTEKPLANFPQKFYRGEHPLLLDLSAQPEIKMLRAHWEVARWGRGEPAPMFEFELRVREVPAETLQQKLSAAGSKL